MPFSELRDLLSCQKLSRSGGSVFNMEQKIFHQNELIFRQGDAADCMYAVRGGCVGIFLDYGGPGETKLTELREGQYFGEMGLLDSAPRSATAVSLSDGTALERINDEDFQTFFEENPDQIVNMLQQMCSRLRRVTRNYDEACRTVHDVVEAEKAGAEKSDALKHRIEKTLAGYESTASDEQK